MSFTTERETLAHCQQPKIRVVYVFIMVYFLNLYAHCTVALHTTPHHIEKHGPITSPKITSSYRCQEKHMFFTLISLYVCVCVMF